MNMPGFFCTSSLPTCWGWVGVVISWLSLDFVRSDEDICDGEKPCIMLADLVRTLDETLVSDPRSLLSLLTVLANVTFEKHESDELCRLDSGGDVSVPTSGNGDEGRGVISAMASGMVC